MTADPRMADWTGPVDETYFAEQRRRLGRPLITEPVHLFDAPPEAHQDDDDEGADTRDRMAAAAPRPAVVDGWPAPLEPAAYHGLAGRIVDFAEPYTEADPVAVLGTFLTAFGCALNAGPHARVGPERHPARLFVALIGTSSTARKGTSWAPIRELLALVDPDFVAHRVLGGLGSGEALIHAVRDGDGDKDPGVIDKRALVFAPELPTILRVMARQGSILSGNLKEAWDSGRLQNVVKTNPATATGAHVSMLAHSTAAELARDLTDTDARSGFGNRLIYLAVRRSKLLPSPPSWDDAPVAALARDVTTAMDVARRRSTLHRDSGAEELWRSVYGHLTRDRYGLAGILTSRAEAQVLRLSLIYALLDGETAIRLPHLQAALAVWAYAERSANYIFGHKTGDHIADAILEHLGHEPMSRASIYSDLFGRHVRRTRIDAAIDALVEHGIVLTRKEATGGRPTEYLERVR